MIRLKTGTRAGALSLSPKACAGRGEGDVWGGSRPRRTPRPGGPRQASCRDCGGWTWERSLAAPDQDLKPGNPSWRSPWGILLTSEARLQDHGQPDGPLPRTDSRASVHLFAELFLAWRRHHLIFGEGVDRRHGAHCLILPRGRMSVTRALQCCSIYRSSEVELRLRRDSHQLLLCLRMRMEQLTWLSSARPRTGAPITIRRQAHYFIDAPRR